MNFKSILTHQSHNYTLISTYHTTYTYFFQSQQVGEFVYRFE